MALIVADTDVLIDYLRGWEPMRSRILELLDHGGLAVTAITRFELQVGARSEREQQATSDLLASLQVLPLTTVAADRAASVQLELQQRGETIGLADSLICGIVMEADATLLTRNRRHFARVPGLDLTGLPVDEEVHEPGGSPPKYD